MASLLEISVMTQQMSTILRAASECSIEEILTKLNDCWGMEPVSCTSSTAECISRVIEKSLGTVENFLFASLIDPSAKV